MKTREQIAEWLVGYMAKRASIEPDEIDTSLPFNSYGVDSTEAAGLSGELSEWLGIELSESVAFEHPTIDGLSAYVWEELDIAS